MYVTTDAETRRLNRKRDSGLKNIGPNCFRLQDLNLSSHILNADILNYMI